MNAITGVVGAVILASGILLAGSAKAYTERVHVRLTNAAFDRSILADLLVGPLVPLGIEDAAIAEFSTIPSQGIESTLASAHGLVAWGAYYEDNPMSELRMLRHFLDPQQGNRGFKGEIVSSADWVLEPQINSFQLFSLRDAHQLYLDALTLPNASTRKTNTILFLQSIGRAVHHLQDMAQPAHARDDAHLFWPGDDDFYEDYTHIVFAEETKRALPVQNCGQRILDLHDFDEARKFWVNNGRGIAEFSSTQFVSQDTNFSWDPTGWHPDFRHRLPSFPLHPEFDRVSLRSLGVRYPHPDLLVEFLSLPIKDAVSDEGCTNLRASTRSFVADNFTGVRPWPGYSLNRFNFEAGYPILFPRAIEYSAGLINYIFRGRLKLESYVEDAATAEIVIRNDSAAEFAMFGHPESGVEEFSLYYDAQDGARKRIVLPNGELVNTRLEYGDDRTFSFAVPADLDETKERPFVLVFNGMIGKERGIAALAIGKQDSTFVVTPNYAVTDGNEGPRVLEEVRGAWRTSTSAGNRAGNVDWRGHGPDDVLTWDGPSSRFYGVTSASRNIYQGGKVLTTAPAPVIGAAIAKTASGRNLLAAVNDGTFKIYRRPYQLSYHKDGMYHELNNPFGWVLLYSGPVAPTSPMFFNASGTEAQVFAGWDTRYKITISGSSASSVTISNLGTFKRAHRQTSERKASVEATPGPPQSCRANGTICLSRGECDGNPNTCLISQAGEVVSNSYVVDGERTTENVASTIVCADYKGDQEVLCRVEADETPWTTSLTSVGRFTQSRTVTLATCNNAVVTGETDYEHDLRGVDETREVMVLKVGTKTLPLSGAAIHKDSSARSHVHRLLGLNTEPVVNFSYDETVTSYDTRLLYIDARNDIVVYEDHTRVKRNTGGGSTGATPGNYSSEYWFVAPVRSEARTTSRLIVSAREDHVLSSVATEDQPRQITHHLNAGFVSIEPDSCMSSPALTETDERTWEWPIQEFYSNSLHPKLNDATQSLSAISNAKLVASWPRWVRQADNSYRQEGIWNYLSNGDLPTLLPGGTSTAKYSPTGIVR